MELLIKEVLTREGLAREGKPELFAEEYVFPTLRIFDLEKTSTAAESCILTLFFARLLSGCKDDKDIFPSRVTWLLVNATLVICRA